MCASPACPRSRPRTRRSTPSRCRGTPTSICGAARCRSTRSAGRARRCARRAGRFFAPFGLRSQDHNTYVRRYLGFHSWEETFNVSGGRVENDWEVHATAFAAVPYGLQGNGSRAAGGVVYWERRLSGDHAVVAAQARAAGSETDRTYLAGGIGKYYLESAKVLVMGEADVGLQDFEKAGPTRPQFAGYFPATGFMVGTALERFDEDMSVADLARDAASLTFQYFPLAHWELMLIGKLEFQGG